MEQLDNRTNSATAKLVNQGIAWQETYGPRSAAAFLAHRDVPRAIIRRVVDGRAQSAVRALPAVAAPDGAVEMRVSGSFHQPIQHTKSARE